MWEILYLLLRTPTAIAPLNIVTFLGEMSRLSACIAGLSRLIVGLLFFTCVVVVVVVLGRPLVHALSVEVFSLTPFPFNLTLLIVIVVLLLHCSFYIHCSVI